MSKWEDAILLGYPEVVADVILMMMGIHNGFGMEGIAEFQKPISTMGKPCIDH
jgi:hypothetical protein